MDPAFDLRSTLSRAAESYKVCDAVVATVRNRQADAVEAVGGCLSEASPQPDSVFQAASLSKPVFAYAVLKLVEQGKLTLDTPLLAYLPDGYRHQSDPFQLRPNSKGEQVTDARLAAVTVRMALNHTSGWPNWSSGPITFGSDPGTRWQYSGEGYVLLQRAVEAVTGKKLDRYMSEQVFQPLKMLDSSFVWNERFDRRLVPGTASDGSSLAAVHFRSPVSAATLYTTAPDYARFLAAVLADERLLALIADSPAAVESRLGLSWGNGWGIERVGASAYLWQWGNNPGYRSFVMVDPATGSGFVLLTNSERGQRLAEPIANGILPNDHRVFRFRLL